MKIGACCSSDRIKAVRDAGYDYWEVNITYLTAASEEEFLSLKETVRTMQFPAEAGNCFFPGSVNLYEIDRSDLKSHTEKALLRLSELGGRIAVIRSGKSRRIPEGMAREQAEKTIGDLLYFMGDIAKKYGITLVIEPLNTRETNFINTVEEGLYFCQKVGHPNVKCLADFYHVFLSGESLNAVKASSGNLSHVHIAIGNGRRVPMLADEDICKEYKKALEQCGYQGKISVEAIVQEDFESKIKDAHRLMELFRNGTVVSENKINVTEYNVSGRLPDPFMMKNGTRITHPSQWETRGYKITESPREQREKPYPFI